MNVRTRRLLDTIRERNQSGVLVAIALRALASINVLFIVLGAALPGAAEPLRLHPDNPHYFLFRGRPTVLVGSGEHYGAVLNRSFDYAAYLDELAKRGLNLTRTFSGVYREDPKSFGIVENTLAPEDASFVSPWLRTDALGTSANGRKFDLSRWNPEYFSRLRDFVAAAGKRGVVVELVLFCAIYDENLWAINPFNPANNVNGLAPGGRDRVYTLEDPKLTAFQDALARKIVEELRDADNVYFEICNEPYFGGVTREWNAHLVHALADAEKALSRPHLIAQNISNGSTAVKNPEPGVSILNFHYSTPPDSVAQNYGLKLAVADDETGFRGAADALYRSEGWEFLLAGGAAYSNLDYSFSVSHPDGTLVVAKSPGGGGAELRRQLGILKSFMDRFDFVRMRPDAGAVKIDKPGGEVRALIEPGKQYAIYARASAPSGLVVRLPPGHYEAEWIDTKTGKPARTETFDHATGAKTFSPPAFHEDIALRIVAK